MKQGGTYNPLGNGVIKRRDTGKPCNYQIRLLNLSDLSHMMQLQETVVSRISHPHIMQYFPEDFMKLHLEKKGFSLGVVIEDELIAFRNTYFPDRDEPEWNLGPDLGLPVHFFDSLVNLQFSCVHPNYRGNSLGYIMMRCALQRIKAIGKYSFCCATVSPFNFWSVDILLRNKLTIRNLKTKYDGKLRYLVCQNLQNFNELEIRNPITVSLTDFDRQHELFAQGFTGVEIKKTADIMSLPRKELAKGYEVLFIRSPLF